MFVYLLLIFVLLYVCVNSARQREKQTSLPALLPGALPIIGHAHLFLVDNKNIWRWIKIISEESLKTGGVTICMTLCYPHNYFISDPDDLMNIANNCLEKNTWYGFGKPWLGDGLVTAELSIWKRHRKLIQPSFNQKVLDSFIGVFNDRAKCLAETLSAEVGKGPVILSDYIKCTSLETILLTAMGFDEDCDNILQNNEYKGNVLKVFNILAKRASTFWKHSEFLYSFTNDKRQMNSLIKFLHNYSNEVIVKRKAAMKRKISSSSTETGTRFKSFLDQLLELSVQDVMTDKEIQEEVDTMIVAGYDTIVHTVIFVLVMIGSYPRIQKRIYEELQDIFKNNTIDIVKEDLPKLAYLEAVIKETIRLYPTVPVLGRYVDKDIKLKNSSLPAGSDCFLLPYAVHRHPIWGLDAEEFKPERWLNPDTLPDHPGAFAGFGIGKRSCIGQKFAMMSMKSTLSHILRRYELSADYTKMEFSYEIFLEPVAGHQIGLEHRSILLNNDN